MPAIDYNFNRFRQVCPHASDGSDFRIQPSFGEPSSCWTGKRFNRVTHWILVREGYKHCARLHSAYFLRCAWGAFIDGSLCAFDHCRVKNLSWVAGIAARPENTTDDGCNIVIATRLLRPFNQFFYAVATRKVMG